MTEDIKNDCGASVKQLKELQVQLNEQLDEAIHEVDTYTVLTLKDEIAKMPMRILSAEIIELKQKIKDVENDIEQGKENISLIEQVRVARKDELEKQIDAVHELEESYKKATFELSLATINNETMRQNRNELKKELEKLMEQMRRS